MADPAHTYVEPHERASRLHELDFREEWLFNAILMGLAARKGVTAFHPPIYGGVSQWAETHVGLREQCVPSGRWEANDRGNFATVIRGDGRIAITVATGTDRTGIPGLPEPMTKYSRGPMTHAAIERNLQLTIPFFDAGTDELTEHVIPETWYLLIHTRYDEVRFELSCPRHIGVDGRIDSWSERIIIPPLDTDTFFGGHGNGDDDPGSLGGPIDVPVEPL